MDKHQTMEFWIDQASLCAAIRIAKEQQSVSLENAPKQPARTTVAKKRAGQEDVDFEYLFGNMPVQDIARL